MRAWLLLLALVSAAAAEPMPSPVVLPVQRLPISFSHQRHLAIAGTGCGTCHADAAASRRAADVLTPPEAACTDCHKIDRARPDGSCGKCHVGFTGEGQPARVVIPPPNLKFNHAIHETRDIRCVTCHATQRVDLATRAQLPRMPSCLGCHDGKQAPAACTTCHLAEGPGRLRTDFPEGQLVPSGTLRGDAHDLAFRTNHAPVAKSDEKYCASCHARSFCIDCHDGKSKPLDFHVNDYVTLHAADARRATVDCESCHRRQTFCTGCHARLGVSDDPKTTQYDRPSRMTTETPRLFHSATYDAEHKLDARRNLRACASCHRETFCMDCHTTQDPHPADWAQSPRCRALAARAGRTCLRCHLDEAKAKCD